MLRAKSIALDQGVLRERQLLQHLPPRPGQGPLPAGARRHRAGPAGPELNLPCRRGLSPLDLQQAPGRSVCRFRQPQIFQLCTFSQDLSFIPALGSFISENSLIVYHEAHNLCSNSPPSLFIHCICIELK